MPRVVWKGAISFGLVHIPVALYPANRDMDIDFDWLDKRTMDPVGYKRINKRTGKEIEREHIVKGIQQEDKSYVILSAAEIEAAYPKTTQTIALESFVNAAEIPFVLLERPYFLEPSGPGGDKVYALLRDAMKEAGVIGIARVVMHTKEHLAVLVPMNDALILNTIRWANELLPTEELKFPTSVKLKPAELKMAQQLVEEMTQPWKPVEYTDTFTEAIHALVKKKVEAGDTEEVTPLEEAPDQGRGSNVVDLTELLRNSLGKKAKVIADAPAKKRGAA